MKSELREQKEAIKAVADWSNWLVTIATGTLVLGTSSIKDGSLVGGPGKTLAFASLVLLTVSVAAACMIVLAVPAMLQRAKEDDDVFELGTFNGVGIKLGVIVVVQNGAFWLAFAAYVAAVGLRLQGA